MDARETHTHTNSLVNESSPYLLQHAHNPVNWYAWNEQALAKAVAEDRLIIISIGYSACHWCHVMEHECFEDEETARLMNDHFINIKVDREERPDVDQVYMNAVQIMTGRGGWPLNCIALPDGRPLYGGTYFPKTQWQDVLNQVARFYKTEKEKCIEYAEELMGAVNKPPPFLHLPPAQHFSRSMADEAYRNWMKSFDMKKGGHDRSPKFPLPNNYEFLLRYFYHTELKECFDYVTLSLEKMAFGGIYDQVGGGFARYSTDADWKVPHFEKMLYDNAQLVSLYSHAWQLENKSLYRDVVYETLDFIERELNAPDGGFYAALDADSEGEEGKYYVWKREEIGSILGSHATLFMDYYNVNETGLWEHGNYILLRTEKEEAVAKRHGLSLDRFRQTIRDCRKKLLDERQKRIRPGLDNKIIVSWNALMVKAYIDAYNSFNETRFLEIAISAMNFLTVNAMLPGGIMYHTCNSGAVINGFLEDYCFAIEALLALYETTGREEYLYRAKELAEYCFIHFFDETTGFFYFSSDLDPPLAARKMETEDNVIPGSCSSLALSLHILGCHFSGEAYGKVAAKMLSHITDSFIRYGSGYSNWGILLLNKVYPFYEIVVAGPEASSLSGVINGLYMPGKILAASDQNGSAPLLENRFVTGKTLIYVCEGMTCKFPVTDVRAMMQQIKRS